MAGGAFFADAQFCHWRGCRLGAYSLEKAGVVQSVALRAVHCDGSHDLDIWRAQDFQLVAGAVAVCARCGKVAPHPGPLPAGEGSTWSAFSMLSVPLR